MSDLETVQSTMTRFESIVTSGIDALSEQSLHEYTAPTNITALYMVDEAVATSPILKDLLGLQLVINTARVAMAFELRNKIDGVSVVEHIKSARLGARENKSLFRRIFGLEDIEIRNDLEEETTEQLIQKGSFNKANFVDVAPTDEAEEGEVSEVVASEAFGEVNSNRKLLSDMEDAIANFAVGTTFDIKLRGETTKEPVTVTLAMRISPVGVQSDVVKAILEVGSEKNSFMERFYALKAGDISLRQFITFSDIVDQQVAILLKDKSGYYREVLKRQTANRRDGILSMFFKEKVERAKTIGGLIIDADTLAQSEYLLGGSFDSPTIRDRVFLTTSAATICVIDNNWETVKIYYRGVTYVETYTFNQIKRTNKGGISVEDMLSAFRRGGAPKL
jgi:hypothetical protein